MASSTIKRLLKPVYNLGRLRFQDWKRTFYYQYFPAKPEVINLNANDICNSKCTMCNIWQQKQDIEISPEQLSQIFTDPLFSNIKHIGITGGEPTLREDLPGLYEAACKQLPNLKGLSIITNAIKSKDVIKRILEVKEVCDRYGKTFSIMVSLDGVGQTHEKIRGREGNFESAMEVINYFRNNTKIPVAIGCTISKENVWEVDALLDFLKKENIYGRFRIAEFIQRLYNADRGDVIRNFTEEEKYHLQCFFQKLIMTYEKDETYQRTYRSIINILGGGQRTIGCPYQSKGLVLDSRGDIHYCAPKSRKIGNALKISALQTFNGHLSERRRIMKEHCSDCVHDYHAPLTYREQVEQYKTIFWKLLYRIDHISKASWLKIPLLFSRPNNTNGLKRVYIVGWYGTETVGDKAILGGIIDFYREKYQNKVAFFISSIYPFVTKKTIRELDCPDATVIPFHSYDFAKYAAHADEVVMGGGPLMDMETLSIPQWAFNIAKLFKRHTVVFGCGLGPLKEKRYINAVKDILLHSDEIKLRDSKSVEYAATVLQLDRKDIVNSGDSAHFYISALAKKMVAPEPTNTLACFLREWTSEYQGQLSKEAFLAQRDAFEQGLATAIQDICSRHQLTPAFYPMHTFTVGNDDRDFYRRFVNTYFKDTPYVLYQQNATIEIVVKAMTTSKMNLCMRFHSVLFASTLRTNFLAVDYTNGGKILGYLSDHQETDRMISLQQLAENDTEAIRKWYTKAHVL